ncbi:MAG: Gfo/Idh/MocA family protein [Thermoanaerobaculia bacterium]
MEFVLAGCGRWGRRILITLAAQGERVWVVEPSEEARRGALERGAAGAVPDVSLVGRIDAAIVAVPTRRHAHVIGTLAPRAVPIFCEKPLTDDAESADRLAGAHERLFVMDKWRYHPAVEEMTRIVRSRELGTPLSLRTVRVQAGVSGHDVDPVWILAPHDISIAREILGAIPRPLRAEAETSGSDALAMTAACEVGGISFTFEVSSRASDRRREIELVCERGTVRWTIQREHEVAVSTTGVRPVSPELPLDRELSAFRGYVQGGPPPKASARDGAETVRLIERLRALAGIMPSGRRSL